MFLVCGEALYDVFLDSGENPAAFAMNARAGGSPFNVAMGLARLEQPSALLTGMSRDELGNRLTRMLEIEGVSTDYLVRTGRRTTVVMFSLSESGVPDYAFYGVGSADCGVTEAELPALGPEINGIHFGSYSLVVKPVADSFAALLEANAGRFISVDPNIRPTIEPDMAPWRARLEQYACHADLLKISAEDIEYLYPGRRHPDFAAEMLAAGVQLVVVTDGGDAVHGWSQAGLEASARPRLERVVDTVGAGDTFQAALLARLLETGDPAAAVRALDQAGLDGLLGFATRAAAITCSRRGADLPRLAELA